MKFKEWLLKTEAKSSFEKDYKTAQNLLSLFNVNPAQPPDKIQELHHIDLRLSQILQHGLAKNTPEYDKCLTLFKTVDNLLKQVMPSN